MTVSSSATLCFSLTFAEHSLSLHTMRLTWCGSRESLASSSKNDHRRDGSLCRSASWHPLRLYISTSSARDVNSEPGIKPCAKYMRISECSLKVFYLNIFSIHRRDISILVESFVASNKEFPKFSYQKTWISSVLNYINFIWLARPKYKTFLKALGISNIYLEASIECLYQAVIVPLIDRWQNDVWWAVPNKHCNTWSKIPFYHCYLQLCASRTVPWNVLHIVRRHANFF